MFESRLKNAVCPPSQIIQTERTVWAENKSCVCLRLSRDKMKSQWFITTGFWSMSAFLCGACLLSFCSAR